MTLIRRIGNPGMTMLVKVLYGSGFTDLCYGYCVFRRELLERVVLDANSFKIEMHFSVGTSPEFPRLRSQLEARRNSGQSNVRAIPRWLANPHVHAGGTRACPLCYRDGCAPIRQPVILCANPSLYAWAPEPGAASPFPRFRSLSVGGGAVTEGAAFEQGHT